VFCYMCRVVDFSDRSDSGDLAMVSTSGRVCQVQVPFKPVLDGGADRWSRAWDRVVWRCAEAGRTSILVNGDGLPILVMPVPV